MKAEELYKNIYTLKRIREDLSKDEHYKLEHLDRAIELFEIEFISFPDCADCHGSGITDCYCSDCRSKGIVGKSDCVMCNGIGKLDKT